MMGIKIYFHQSLIKKTVSVYANPKVMLIMDLYKVQIQHFKKINKLS